MVQAKQDKPLVEIKGYGGGLGLFIDHQSPIEQIEAELHRLLQRPEKRQFLQGATIFFRPEERTVSPEEFQRLQLFLQQEGNLDLQEAPTRRESPTADTPPIDQFVSEPPPTHTILSPSLEPPPATPEPPPSPPELSTEPISIASTMSELSQYRGLNVAHALIVNQTLRSGQDISTDKTVIVVGDLNAGAEIISEESVVVLGTLRGMVHAGVSGNRKAFVFALRMRPIQIRIAEMITQPPSEGQVNPKEPEIAYIDEGSIVIEPCHKIRV